MKTRTLLLALTMLATALAGCAEESDNGNGNGAGSGDPTPTISSLTVGTEAAYPPFEDIVNNEIVGFDIDVMREVAKRAGFNVTFQNAEFNAIIPTVQNGQLGAGVSAFTITDDRKQQVDFSVPYYANTLMVAVPASDAETNEPDDLQGKKVCTQEGTTSETYLKETLEFEDADLLLLDSAPLCAEALKRGDVSALMIDAAFVRSVIASSQGQIKQAFLIEDVDEEFGIVVQKGNTELLSAINTALNAMKSDGTLQQLVDKWQV